MTPETAALQDLIRHLGMTYTEVARRSGLSYRTIKNVLKERHQPRYDTQRRILIALGKSWEDRRSYFKVNR